METNTPSSPPDKEPSPATIEGKSAFMVGRPANANPYDEGIQSEAANHREWDDGYTEAAKSAKGA